MVFEGNFLRFTERCVFKKSDCLKNVNTFFQLISYNIVVYTKQIYLSPTFLKSWLDFSGEFYT